MSASVNYFFKPYYRKAMDLQHFAFEPFYAFLRNRANQDQPPQHVFDPDRWRRPPPAPPRSPDTSTPVSPEPDRWNKVYTTVYREAPPPNASELTATQM